MLSKAGLEWGGLLRPLLVDGCGQAKNTLIQRMQNLISHNSPINPLDHDKEVAGGGGSEREKGHN